YAVYDVLQHSLLGLAVIGAGMAYLAYRLPRVREAMTFPRIAERLTLAWTSRVVPIGIVAMALFAVQNGLQRTSAVFDWTFGLWGALLPPALLLFSILHGFLSIGLLFVVVYPLLPFKIGYLKAVTLALFLLLGFVAGIGTDERLITSLDGLLVGRLVYYLGVPLLIGLYFDVDQIVQAQQAQDAPGHSGSGQTRTEAWLSYVKQLRGMAGTIGAVVSLVAPGAYAFVTGTPLLTSQFDLLDRLLSLSLPT
ncbi:MAG: hypothetical protein ACRDI2_26955, partial [Chloroflexota bacterium]